MAISESGPLSLSEILDRMFAIYRRYFLTLIGTTILPFLLLIPVGAFVGAGMFAMFRSRTAPADIFGIGFGAILAVYFVFLIAYCVSWIAVTAAVWETQLGRTPTIRGSYQAAWRNLWQAVLAGVCFGLIVGIGMVFFIVPGVLLALALSLIGPIILAEGAGPIEALSRSWDLTKGYKGKIFVIWLICLGISMAMTYGLQIPMLVAAGLLFKGGSNPIWFAVISGLCSVVGSILPAPLQTTALCLVYHDARVRKEGMDLQRMIDTLAPPPLNAPQTQTMS